MADAERHWPPSDVCIVTPHPLRWQGHDRRSQQSPLRRQTIGDSETMTGRTNKKGAGRPLSGQPRMVSISATLPVEQVVWLKKQGNLSKALRVVIQTAKDAADWDEWENRNVAEILETETWRAEAAERYERLVIAVEES